MININIGRINIKNGEKSEREFGEKEGLLLFWTRDKQTELMQVGRFCGSSN